jgi:acyl-CoA synthetase (AMP-forming)/AMP-acid ligase II
MVDRLPMLRAVARTGVLRPARPDRIVRMVRSARRWGLTPATLVAVSAARYPQLPAVVDSEGELDWATLDVRTSRVAAGLVQRGLVEPPVIGILCRNHRGFVEALVVAGKMGADAVLLNTGFAGPQLGEVAGREQVTLLVHDREFEQVVQDAGLAGGPRFVVGPGTGAAVETFDELVEGATGEPPPPGRNGQVVLLSSGTTGTPKGARRAIDSRLRSREERRALASQLALITRLPLRAGEPTVVAAPMFHAWGFTAGMLMCGALSNPMILRGRFDAEDTLAAVDRHRAGALIAVPAMLQRILDLPSEVRQRYDTSSLRVVALSGSALPGGLATRWMDVFGDHLYSLYGSTEVSGVALAGPQDLRADPDTAGPLLPGTSVRLLDADSREVPPGEPGRIFASSGLLFDGYTGGESKEMIDGFMSTGDMGRFDDQGRLQVVGREDDMIVSGGENVFPQEIEEVLFRHPAVADVAVVGVVDDRFGQRLRAVVVPAAGEAPSAEDLREWVRSSLANYKVPRDVVFRDELPRNPTGKVLRRVLLDEAATGRS